MKKRRGQAVVEAALVLPLLLLLFCMIVDTGRIIYSKSMLNSICQESVRIAGLGQGDDAVKSYAASKLDASTLPLDWISITPYDRRSGDFVTVDLKIDINYITPFASAILPSPFVATAESTIRVE